MDASTLLRPTASVLAPSRTRAESTVSCHPTPTAARGAPPALPPPGGFHERCDARASGPCRPQSATPALGSRRALPRGRRPRARGKRPLPRELRSGAAGRVRPGGRDPALVLLRRIRAPVPLHRRARPTLRDGLVGRGDEPLAPALGSAGLRIP